MVMISLYLLLFLPPVLGLIASQAHGDRVEVFGMFALPSLIATNLELSREIFTLHVTAAFVLLALIGMHAGAAL